MSSNKSQTTAITDDEIEAGAQVLAERFFIVGTQQKMSYFSSSQQQAFRDKALAVLEAARKAKDQTS